MSSLVAAGNQSTVTNVQAARVVLAHSRGLRTELEEIRHGRLPADQRPPISFFHSISTSNNFSHGQNNSIKIWHDGSVRPMTLSPSPGLYRTFVKNLGTVH
jgi:hypothetical protein